MKCLIFAGILLGIYHTCSGNQCDLTIQKDGLELQDGEYVIGLGGQINQIYCKALCSGPGPTPALKWYKTPSKRPVTMFRGRMHQVRTTFDRVNILTIRNMLYSDIGIYKCKGWLKDQGWVEKSFELTYGCRGLDHQCDTSTCLRHTYVCNGHVDCQDGTDEQNCRECKANQYHCHNGDCIDGSYVCDGYNDCIDASDELNCGNV
ncbi:sortilin-related receptor-like isoform X2 [Ruditapes philippinarum]|uniref:sortilin-related receptor-like isoform X2 n=1 Tax=Ruditapes philippinarum TaxID=129788 RepID=UPI00295A68DC|nr:sortilin-related receptor-like isoform X2 [Ruditapes philippinarum]